MTKFYVVHRNGTFSILGASHFRVQEDGTLFLYDADDTAVAVFVSGSWLSCAKQENE